MLHRLDRVTSESLGRLSREFLTDFAEIRALLEQAREQRTVLRNGINWRNDPRNAWVQRVNQRSVSLKTENFDRTAVPQIFLNFDVDRCRYFFAAVPLPGTDGEHLEIEIPSTVYRAERRDLYRNAPTPNCDWPARVELRASPGKVLIARVTDWSLYGIGAEVGAREAMGLPARFAVRFLDGDRSGHEVLGRVCHTTAIKNRRGRVRLGVALSNVEPGPRIEVDCRDQIIEQGVADRARDKMTFFRSALGWTPRRIARKIGIDRSDTISVPIVDYENDRGQRIRAIADTLGDSRGAPAIVIPPAWGRTKETLLPLAATLLETFRRAGEPVTIIRFDGTNRRGESHVDPECRLPAGEYLHFTFSQAVRDIQATVDFLHSSPRYQPSTTILVTFSLAAVEGRRAVSEDRGKRIGGWVSVVGMVDLQSALRMISGGIDYGYGLLQGVRFGHHELVGVLADMDHTGLDAIEHKLGFLEEARQDFAAITVPITWIHGRHDAWMDLDRVRDALSYGDSEKRKLLEVPTGHQLRNSRQALSTFQLIAEEVGEMALGRRLKPALPPLSYVEKRREAERRRLPEAPSDMRGFWTDYLLGRDRRLGFELISATAAYRNFMETQIVRLRPRRGERIADLGAGTGEFPVSLLTRPDGVEGVTIDAFDYIPEVLRRARERVRGLRPRSAVGVRCVIADLDAGFARHMSIADESYDAVLASLLISYLEKPEKFLREVFRILRRGGRLVLSTLKRDADISKLYMDGIVEFHTPEARRSLGETAVEDFESLVRNLLNDASKILDFEERGRFRFWDPQELRDLVSNAGYSHVRTELSFGDPPQAVVLTARRP